MSRGAFRVGWHVVRARRSEFLDAHRVRRRTVLCGAVATAVGSAATVADVAWGAGGRPWMLQVVAIVCFAAAAGSLVATFVRVGSPAADVDPAGPSGDWRRQERIARQFTARPPTMAPEDRDAVLDHADRAIPVAVVMAERFLWNPVAWVSAWIGLLALGSATTDRVTLLLVPPVFAVLQSATWITAVTNAGRAETTRARAALLPALPAIAPVDDAARRHGRVPRGSKIELLDG